VYGNSLMHRSILYDVPAGGSLFQPKRDLFFEAARIHAVGNLWMHISLIQGTRVSFFKRKV
jgi:hypothetical protein